MKTLLAATMYLGDNGAIQSVHNWLQCQEKYNKNADVLFMDAFSPMKYVKEVRGLPRRKILQGRKICRNQRLKDKATFLSHPDNVGHFTKGGGDGWGRAFSQCVQIAIDNEYDYLVHCEYDLHLKLNVNMVATYMKAQNIKAIIPRTQYGFVEICLMFLDVNFLDKCDFIGKYNWLKPRPEIPEVLVEKVLGTDNIHCPDWPGARCDNRDVSEAEAREMVYMTHCPQHVQAYMDAEYDGKIENRLIKSVIRHA